MSGICIMIFDTWQSFCAICRHLLLLVPASMKGSYWAIYIYVNAPNNYAPTGSTLFIHFIQKYKITASMSER